MVGLGCGGEGGRVRVYFAVRHSAHVAEMMRRVWRFGLEAYPFCSSLELRSLPENVEGPISLRSLDIFCLEDVGIYICLF